MTSVIFLISGGGGNLKFVKWASEMLALNIKIGLVITDRPCGGLEFSEAQGIPHKQIAYRKDFVSELHSLLRGVGPSVVITNMHKILDLETLQTGHKFINLHYSILPAFKGLIGMKPVLAARSLKSPFVGVTTHHVIEEVDSGEIMQQAVCNILWNDRPYKEVEQAIFKLGAITLLNTIIDNRKDVVSPECLKIDNFDVWASHALQFDYHKLEQRDIWQRVSNGSV